MSTWLFPAIISTMGGTVVLTIIYYYLYKQEAKNFLGVWALGWLVSSLRYFTQLLAIQTGTTITLSILHQLFTLFSGVFLLWGTFLIIAKKMPNRFWLVTASGIIWIIINNILQINYVIAVTPVFIFLCIVHVWTGIVITRISGAQVFSKTVTGWAFIIWGLHKIDYPFLSQVMWFAPWGYLISAVLEMVVAIGMLVIYFEINRQSFKRTEERLELLADKFQDVLYSVQIQPTIKINYLSPAFTKLSGYSIAEAEANPEILLQIVHPEDQKRLTEYIENALKSPRTLLTMRLLRKDKKNVWVEFNNTSIIDKENKLIGFEGIIRDITERVEVEKLIQREKMFSERIMETSPIGITIINPLGEIIYANKEAENIFGLTKKTITGRNYNTPDWNISDFNGNPIDENDLPFQQVMRTGKTIHRFHHVIENPNGNRVFLSITSSPLFDENGKIESVIALVEDITTQYQAERALQESEKKYRVLFERLLNGFALHEIILDDKGKACNYRFIDANPAFCQATGLKREKLIGATVLDVLPKTEKYWIDAYGDVALKGKPLHFQNYSQELNRHFEVVAYSPIRGQFATIVSDITDRIRAEQELQIALRDIRQRSYETTALLEAARSVLLNTRFYPAANSIFITCLRAIAAKTGFISLVSDTENSIHIYSHEEKISTIESLPPYIRELHYQSYLNNTAIIENDITIQKNEVLETFNFDYPDNILLSPLVINEKVIGILVLMDKQGGFSQNDLNLAAGFSEITAIAFANSHNLESLEESEERFRSVTESAKNAIITINSQEEIIYWNKAAQFITGYTNEDVIGKNIHLILPDFPKIYSSTSFEANQNEKHFSIPNRTFENTATRKNGDLFPLEATYSRWNTKSGTFFTIIFSDISERKTAEKALKISEERYRTLVESINEVIFILDNKGNFLYISPRIKEILGYQADKMIGKNISHFTLYEDSEIIRTFLERSTQNELSQYELRLVAKDQSIHHLIISSRPQMKEDHATEVSGIMADITERKQIQEALAASQKLANIGTLTAAVAHELKSPLQVIVGTSESIIRRVGQDDIDREYIIKQLETINRNGWRISAITGSLLNYARSSDGDIEEDDLNDIVNDTLLLIEHQLANWSKITVQTDLAVNPPPLRCNRNKITQVIINLLMNAKDAMPSGGDITLLTKYDETAHQVILQVRDTGTGIPQNIRSKIFDAFFTTKSKGKGSGLGLSISRDIINEHNGAINIDSEPGKGTVFSIYFPAVR